MPHAACLVGMLLVLHVRWHPAASHPLLAGTGMDLWELDVRCAPQPAGARHAPFPDACPRSERSLYLALAAISAGAAAAASEHTVPGTGAVVFCGANAADLSNAARAGLRRASELPGVVNPLEDLPPAAVTALAQVRLQIVGHRTYQ